MKRILLGGIVGGVVLFVWGALAHMVLPIWTTALRKIPGEDGVLSAMRGAIKEPGVYFFPGADMTRERTKEEEEAWTAKMRAGPRGLLVYHPDGAEPMSARQLGTEAASNILEALLVAAVLAGLRGGYMARVFAAAIFGAVGWLSISASYWNWYGFSPEFSQAELIDQVAGWLAVGVVMAAIVRPVPGAPKT